jgi:diacylglycerol kinase (ATP)
MRVIPAAPATRQSYTLRCGAVAATLAILNPRAGNGAAARVWAHVQANVPEVRQWDCATTQAPGDATHLAASACGTLDRVVVIGGDGTASEVANGLAHSKTAMAIIPAGTGNDLRVNLGIPADPVSAAQLAATGEPRPIDLGEIQQPNGARYFVNIAGFGFDAQVAERVNKLPKLGGGTLPYLAGVLQTLWQYRSPSMRLTLDQRVVEEPVFLVAVANCASYGGGMRIAPRAEPDDGAFDVCIVKNLSRLEVLRLLPKLYSGRHVTHSAVEIVRCREVSADASGRVLCQADGELVGALPARFAIRPGALQCVTPRRQAPVQGGRQ